MGGEDLTVAPMAALGKVYSRNQKWMGDRYDAGFEPGYATLIWRNGQALDPLAAGEIWRARKQRQSVTFESIGSEPQPQLGKANWRLKHGTGCAWLVFQSPTVCGGSLAPLRAVNLLMKVLHGERNMKALNDNKTPARSPFVGGNYVSCTIKDIAKQVGVSTATVSRVMNGKENVSCETRTAVQSAISRLRYCPNSHAAALGRANGHGPRKRRIQASKSAQTGAKLLTAQQADAQKGSRKSERLYSLEDENWRLRELVNNLRKELERWRASTDGDNRPKQQGASEEQRNK
jgi:hypothetical protein